MEENLKNREVQFEIVKTCTGLILASLFIRIGQERLSVEYLQTNDYKSEVSAEFMSGASNSPGTNLNLDGIRNLRPPKLMPTNGLAARSGSIAVQKSPATSSSSIEEKEHQKRINSIIDFKSLVRFTFAWLFIGLGAVVTPLIAMLIGKKRKTTLTKRYLGGLILTTLVMAIFLLPAVKETIIGFDFAYSCFINGLGWTSFFKSFPTIQ